MWQKISHTLFGLFWEYLLKIATSRKSYTNFKTVVTKFDKKLSQSVTGIKKCDGELLQYVRVITDYDRKSLQSVSGITNCDKKLLQTVKGIT